jgi:hypothetical protein
MKTSDNSDRATVCRFTTPEDRAAKLREDRDEKLGTEWLAERGIEIDRYHQIISEQDSEDDGTEGREFDLSRHTDDATCESSVTFDHDGPDAIEDATQALAVTEAAIKEQPRDGDLYRILELKREAFELRTEIQTLIERNAKHEALAVKSFASDPEFVAAVRDENFPVVLDKLCEVVRENKLPYALLVAAVGGIFQVAPLVEGADDGSKMDDKYLNRLTGRARSSCKELVEAWHALGTGVALLLLGTEDETCTGVQRYARMTPEKLAAAVEETGKYHTALMIAFAGAREDTARARKFKRSELNTLTLVGMNCDEALERLESMTAKQGEQWLAKILDQHLEWQERTGALPKKKQASKPPAFKLTGRTMTQRRFDADNVYEL